MINIMHINNQNNGSYTVFSYSDMNMNLYPNEINMNA